MKIKTRFAPSPTGYMHIGSLRTALFSFLFARQNKGKFVLRIEDTDQKRQVKDADIALIDVLQTIGLKFDEGPFYQSKRLKLYQDSVKQLIKNNQAYYCFCAEDRLDRLRHEQQAAKQVPKYDGHCRNLSKDEIKNGLASKKYVVRFAIPENYIVKAEDLVYGKISVHSKDLDDFVILKSDGFPTYHLANIVDDHDMGISHVIRGEEWLPSLPKHILLYQAFGFELPKFAHLPLLLNPDRSKLSKRQGDVAVEDYLKKGYLPAALINYVSLLGWNPGTDQEIFSLDKLIKSFSLKQINKAGAIFDVQKLNWFNSQYIKQAVEEGGLPLSRLADQLEQIWPVHNDRAKDLLKLFGARLNNLAELKDVSGFLFKLPSFDAKILIFKKSDKKKTVAGLHEALNHLEKISDNKWNEKNIHDVLQSLVGEQFTAGDIFWPVRVALSGQEKSPSPAEIAVFLGKAETLARIKKSTSKLT